MKNRDQVQPGVTRRGVLKGGAAATAGLLAPGLFLPSRAWAAESHPALGSYPAGVQGDSVMVGLTVPLTGPYSAAGKDEQHGYELAMEQINKGDDIAYKWGCR